jgi:sugar phosphate isomerase/epimerase
MRQTPAIDRRRFLALTAAAAASPLAAQAAAQPFFARHKLPVGIQVYSLGDLPRTDLDGTMKQVAAAGYRTLELAGYLGKTPAQLRASFDAAGLACPSAHVGMRAGTAEEPGLFGDMGKLAADMHVLGVKTVIAPSFNPPTDIVIPGNDPGARGMARIAKAMTADHWKRLGAQLTEIGGKLKAQGLAFGYHNHNVEFVPVANSTGHDLMLASTDPRLVSFELDIGWAAAAGKDPAAVFAKNPGRYRAAHMKDVKPSTVPNYELKMDPTEVGSGKLNWAQILPAAYKAGVRNFFVEQEPPFEFPRLVSAQKCYAYLSTLKA